MKFYFPSFHWIHALVKLMFSNTSCASFVLRLLTFWKFCLLHSCQLWHTAVHIAIFASPKILTLCLKVDTISKASSEMDPLGPWVIPNFNLHSSHTYALNGHEKNKWSTVSCTVSHKEHIKFSTIMSFAGIVECNLLFRAQRRHFNIFRQQWGNHMMRW